MPSDLQSLSDEQLARQSQDGSLVAFEELVYRYETRIHSFLAQSCPSPTVAQELAQDTFVRAFQALAQFDSRKTFAPWLFTIARHKCIDYYRRSPPANNEPIPELPDNDDPAELLRDRADLTEQKLQALGPGRRSLRHNHPKGERARTLWGKGMYIGFHD